MRIGVSLQDPSGPNAVVKLRDELQRAVGDGFASAWMSNIFGVDALTALGPQMLRLAGEQTDGTVLWVTGPATVRDA